MRRTFTSLVSLVGAAAVLSGCIKLDADMKVAKDDKFSGTEIVAINAKAFESFGLKKEDLRKQMKDSLNKPNVPAGVKFTSKLYEKGDFIGVELNITDAPTSVLPELLASAEGMASGAGGNLGSKPKPKSSVTFVHKDGKFTMKGSLDLSTDTKTSKSEGEPDLTALLSAYKPEIKMKLTFPGKVVKGTGKISGNSITFTPKFGENNRLDVEAKDS
jgi:hypothetical protein